MYKEINNNVKLKNKFLSPIQFKKNISTFISSKKIMSNHKIQASCVKSFQKSNAKPITRKILNLSINQIKTVKSITYINVKKTTLSNLQLRQNSISPNLVDKINSKNLMENNKSSLSFAKTTLETNVNTTRETMSKKNSSCNARNSKIFTSSNNNKTLYSDNFMLLKDVLKKIKILYSNEVFEQLLLPKDSDLEIKISLAKGKYSSRNNSSLFQIQSDQGISLEEETMKVESIFKEIEQCIINSSTKSNQLNYTNYNNPINEKSDLISRNIRSESEKRVSQYNKLFEICKKSINDISKVILDYYDLNNPIIKTLYHFKENILSSLEEKIQFNNFENDHNDTYLNEDIDTPAIPPSKIISVKKPTEYEDIQYSHKEEKMISAIKNTDNSLKYHHKYKNLDNTSGDVEKKDLNYCVIF